MEKERLTKAERRRLRKRHKETLQQQEVSRRNFMKLGMGVLIATGGLSTSALIAKMYLERPTPLPSGIELLQELSKLDATALNNQREIERLAPQVTKWSSDYFCEYMSEFGYKSDTLQNRFQFDWAPEYIKKHNEGLGCLDAQSPTETQIAYTDIKDSQIYINLTGVFIENASTRSPSRQPMSKLFWVAMHELFHSAPPPRAPAKQKTLHVSSDPTPKIITYHKGFITAFSEPTASKPGMICERHVKNWLEEGTVVYGVTDFAKQYKLIHPSLNSHYERWSSIIDQFIIQRFFNNQYNNLRRLHQTSDPETLSEIIGKRMGAKDPLLAGENYLRQIERGL